MTAVDILANTPRIAGTALSVDAVRFTHQCQEGRPELEKLLGVRPGYGALFNEIVVAESDLELPLSTANEAMRQFFRRYADKVLAELPEAGGLHGRVRRLVEQNLARGDVHAAEVAKRLKMSPRTLQRHLAAEGTTLHEIVEELRKSRALAYLDHGVPIAEAAFLLGYAEPSVFHRAFKRWTSHTPEAWRQKRKQERTQQLAN